MKKKNEPLHENLNEGDDFEVFEEWDEGALPEVPPDESLAHKGNQPDSPEPLPGKKPLKKTAAMESAPEGDKEEAGAKFADELAALSPDVPVNLVAVIGKTRTNVGELIKYRIGQVIDLGRTPGETVDLVANGRLIARGELVEMEGKMAVRILKMVK